MIWLGAKRGKWTDVHVSRRSERVLPLLISLLALGGMLVGLLVLDASRPLVASLVAVIVSFSVATLITQVAKYKISLHVDPAAGAVMVVSLLASLLASPFVSGALAAGGADRLGALEVGGALAAASSERGSAWRSGGDRDVLALWPSFRSLD
jgi:hypothetical protein